jgi:sulfur carrier protein
MKLVIAGEKKEYPQGLTVEALIQAEKVETPQYVTVAVNDAFIESAAFTSTILQDGDQVEFLYFMGGGC